MRRFPWGGVRVGKEVIENMEQKTKRNHYLPKHYLKGFCCEDDENVIWVYDKKLGRIYKTNIINAAVEKNFYDDNGEKFYTNFVEGPAIEAINKIRNHVLITPKEKEIMARYIVHLHSRNLGTRKKNEENWTEIQKVGKQESMEELIKMGFCAEATEKAIEAIHSKDDFKEKVLKQPYAVPNMELVTIHTTWYFIAFRCDEGLITCDNPVYFNNPDGCFKENYAWGVPVSNKILLNGFWTQSQSDQFREKGKQFLREAKKRMVQNAERFVYSSTPQYWIEDYLKK
jgi:hypothetical protein